MYPNLKRVSENHLKKTEKTKRENMGHLFNGSGLWTAASRQERTVARAIPLEIFSVLVAMAMITTLTFPFVLAHGIKKNPRMMDEKSARI